MNINIDSIPVWMLFFVTAFAVMLAVEIGYRIGRIIIQRNWYYKEMSVAVINASILGLVAFMLALTFGMVADRYEARKELAREEANAIGTTYLRADFLPASDIKKVKVLLKEYVDIRLNAVQAHDLVSLYQVKPRVDDIQRQLWDIAVLNVRNNPNSTALALYIQSLNTVIDLHALRLSIGLHSRIPGGIWFVLYLLMIFGMLGVGYETAISDSKKSRIIPILSITFSLVIALIISLDRPFSSFITVSQQSLANLRVSMEVGADATNKYIAMPLRGSQ